MVDSGVKQVLVREPDIRFAVRHLWVFLAVLNLGRVSKRKPDLEMMPDHLKRDIGLADGREPRRDDNRWG